MTIGVIATIALAASGEHAAVAARPWQGVTFMVDSTADEPDALPGNGACATAAGTCTLRAAVMEANGLPGADTVVLPVGIYTLSSAGAADDGGDLDVVSDLTIEGGGARDTVVAGNLAGERVFHVARRGDNDAAPRVALADVSIEGGDSTVGGGIYATAGRVVLDRVVLSGNRADLGGGVMVTDAASLHVANSTVFGNAARQGAGVFLGVPITPGGVTTHTLTNSTVSGNEAEVGAGIANSGWLTLLSVTVSANSAPSGAGLYNSEAITMESSIVAANAGDNCAGTGPVASTGHNLDGDGTCRLGAPGDLPNRDPLLARLADNGGPTDTHLPAVGSPAVDAGATCLAADQRGVARPQGPSCDIGAVEREGAPTTPTTTPSPTPTPSTTPTATTSTRTATVTATSSPTTEPTATSLRPTPTATFTAVPTATTGPAGPVECAWLTGRAPAAAIAAALASPDRVYGWGMLCNPNVPAGPLNSVRRSLSIANPAQRYHPIMNRLVYKCGCP